MKSNKSISPNFCNFKNGQKSIFELGKGLKLLKMQFHEKKFIWFHELFCLDFFKFSGPLWGLLGVLEGSWGKVYWFNYPCFGLDLESNDFPWVNEHRERRSLIERPIDVALENGNTKNLMFQKNTYVSSCKKTIPPSMYVVTTVYLKVGPILLHFWSVLRFSAVYFDRKKKTRDCIYVSMIHSCIFCCEKH